MYGLPTYEQMITNFPFQIIRPGQSDALKAIAQAFEQGKKFIVLEAPTGVGKSGIAIDIARCCGSSYILTSKKDLQQQYLKSFPKMLHTITGRKNWRCLLDVNDPDRDKTMPMLRCDEGVCTDGQSCKYKSVKEQYSSSQFGISYTPSSKMNRMIENHKRDTSGYMYDGEYDSKGSDEPNPCEYYDQKYRGLTANHTVLNYTYFLNINKYTHEIERRGLLVLDESHDLENQMIDFATIDINIRTIENAFQRIEHSFGHGIGLSEFGIIQSNMYQISSWLEGLKKLNSMIDVSVKNYLNRVRENKNIDSQKREEFEARSKPLEEIHMKIDEAIKQFESYPGNWIVSKVEINHNQITYAEFKPVDISYMFKDVFDKGEIVLCMSATILDHVAFCKAVGIRLDDAAFIRVGSDFPLSNRPIFIVNAGKLNQQTIENPETRQKIVDAVDKIMSQYPDKKGIIHTTTYSQVQFIKKGLSRTNALRLIETSSQRESIDVLREHAQTSRPSVLISPSLHSGVDLADDLSRFQIIVKIPYKYLGDPWIQEKKKRSLQWYQWQTALVLVQAYGRSIRSKDDHADTYVLDSGFEYFFRTHRHLLPKWFCDAVTLRLPFKLATR